MIKCVKIEILGDTTIYLKKGLIASCPLQCELSSKVSPLIRNCTNCLLHTNGQTCGLKFLCMRDEKRQSHPWIRVVL